MKELKVMWILAAVGIYLMVISGAFLLMRGLGFEGWLIVTLNAVIGGVTGGVLTAGYRSDFPKEDEDE